jgi:hypothetical protein
MTPLNRGRERPPPKREAASAGTEAEHLKHTVGQRPRYSDTARYRQAFRRPSAAALRAARGFLSPRRYSQPIDVSSVFPPFDDGDAS